MIEHHLLDGSSGWKRIRLGHRILIDMGAGSTLTQNAKEAVQQPGCLPSNFWQDFAEKHSLSIRCKGTAYISGFVEVFAYAACLGKSGIFRQIPDRPFQQFIRQLNFFRRGLLQNMELDENTRKQFLLRKYWSRP